MMWAAASAFLPIAAAAPQLEGSKKPCPPSAAGADMAAESLSPESNSVAKRLRNIEEEMESLAESLTTLLEQAPVFLKTPSSTSPLDFTEQSLKAFRSRVARRIYQYGPLLKEYGDIFESIPSSSEDKETVRQAFMKHQEHFQKFKTNLSLWWRVTERQFHRLRLASLLSHESDDGVKGKDTRQSENVVNALLETREAMESEVERMKLSQARLYESSQTMHTVDSLFSDFGVHLGAAQSALKQLKRRMELDSRYVWWSFLFFISVFVFILLKRTSILRVVVWVGRPRHGIHSRSNSGIAPSEMAPPSILRY